ncbi:hypothetical protein PG993_012317 [Apiospora rasikravindrae]|uniref:Uncharacterized protein n=1 Tax=Apiospora rasikravindrae TaxID=990691 RepID=A0ABR1S224_9PEZI
MDINTEDPSHAAVVAMYQKCVDILSLCLTRSDYHDALEVIDAAVELAEAKEYRASEHHERDYYIKSTSTKPSSSTTPPSPAAAASPPHEDEEGGKVARPSSRRRKSVAWFDQVTVAGTRP